MTLLFTLAHYDADASGPGMVNSASVPIRDGSALATSITTSSCDGMQPAIMRRVSKHCAYVNSDMLAK